MSSASESLVHHVLASQLRIEDRAVENGRTFDELGMDRLDLMLVVLRLEDCACADGDRLLAELDHRMTASDRTTVGDLVRLVDGYVQREATASSLARRAS
jgi:acyl carrier protein